MRSRYCAYFLSLPKYIISTTHPLNNDFKENTKVWENEIKQFSQEFHFEKLTILEFTNDPITSYVTFTAQLKHNQNDESFTEKSKFEKIDNKWLYLSGIHL